MIKLVSEISEYQLTWRNDPKINAWTRQNGLLTSADMINWFKKINADPTIKMFGIQIDNQGQPGHMNGIGTCGLTSIRQDHGTAEFSLFIAPEYHGNGYGKESLIELLKYGFKNLRLNCIWGETMEHNPARHMFKKIGMKEEGKLQERYFKNGVYVNSICYSILAREARQCTWWE